MLGRASATEQDLLRVTVRCDANAPARARAALARLVHLGHGVGDALLVLSELVTNAVRHSGCQPSELLEVCVRLMGRHLRISVRDAGRSGGTAAPPVTVNAIFGGMGLRIVEQLSIQWGTERREDSYVVWAEVPLGP